MKLNREHTIKALECCAKGDCDNCPCSFGDCYYNLARYALALIRELTEENERIAHESECHRQTVIDNLQRSLEFLNEETERVKADTVRKMQERLKEKIHDSVYQYWNFGSGGYYLAEDVDEDIDRIAREMMEEG